MSFDVAIVGGGIVGLAHAWMAARRNLKVVLFDRTSRAQGASVRNFGMIFPIGQPAPHQYSLALRAREFWLELAQETVVDVEPCGAIHLAHHDDEWNVLNEFVGCGSHQAELIDAATVLDRVPWVKSNGLRGGMYSHTELRVDPRRACRDIASWLAEKFDVAIQFDTLITSVDEETIQSSDGRTWKADQTIVCSGSDLQTLFPDRFEHSGLMLCKLQMLKSVKQPHLQTGCPHIASGLTLRHYESFKTCPSLDVLQKRVHHESPELDQYGIHVMASLREDGELILGDSHEYDDDISPFNESIIDDLMIRELKKILELDDWTINQRWSGIYAKHRSKLVFQESVSERVKLFVGTGGAGMTLSFGLADQAWSNWRGEN